MSLHYTSQAWKTPVADTKANPFKPGEMMEVKAKPAKTVLKIRPLKALKAMV